MRAIKISVAVVLACLVAAGGPLARAQARPAATTRPMVGYLPREGLVALWSAEGHAGDSAGNNHGKLKGGVGFAPGKVGRAFKLDGKDDYVDFGNPKALQITGSQTIAMWVRFDRVDVRQSVLHKAYGGEGTIHLDKDPTGELTYRYGSSGSDGEPYCSCTTFGDAGDHVGRFMMGRRVVHGLVVRELKVHTLKKTGIKARTWTHIAVVRDLKARRLRWYVNGALVVEADVTVGQAKASDQPLRIGKGDLANFGGLIDEVGIWNRPLTAEEVRAVYGLTAQAFNPLADGLVSLWTGDGHAKDSVGSNHGKVGNGGTYAADRHGNREGAFLFRREGGFVTIPDSDELDTDEAFTLSCWVKAKSRVGHLIVKYKDARQADYAIDLDGHGGRLHFGAYHREAKVSVYSRLLMPVNQWVHVAATFDRGVVRLYLNGKLEAEDRSAAVKQTNPNEYEHDDITIGAWWQRGTFDGPMDDVAIWGRALSAEEVRGVFAARDLLGILGARAPVVARGTIGDCVVLDSGKVLKGTIENRGYEVVAFFGKIAVPARRVTGIVPLGGGRAWVLLADGQAIVGTLVPDVLRLKLTIGSTLRIPLGSIRQVGWRISEERPASGAASGAMLTLRTGERLAWTRVKEKLQLRTPYGTVDLPAEGLAAIEFDARKGAYRARLSGGSAFCGELLPERLTLSLRLGPQVAIARRQLLRLARPVKPVEPPEAAVAIMRNGDRLVGRVGDKALTIRTRFGLVTVAPQSALTVKFQPPKAGQVAVTVRTWDGTDLQGRLTQRAVTFALAAGGTPLRIPAAQIASITRAVALPPPEILKKVRELVAQLGAESYKDRDAATKELIKMGPNIAPLLRKYLTSHDLEVRRRIRLVLEKLAGNGGGA